MSHHSVHLSFPDNAPFDREDWFENFLGHFVMPVVETGKITRFWFSRYGSPQSHEIRFRLETDTWVEIEPLIQQKITDFGFNDLKDEQNYRNVDDLGNDRFLSQDAQGTDATRRSSLVLDVLHRLCVLYLDTLVGPDQDGYFRQESNKNINNPHGSIFESIHHLLCNITGVVTEVDLIQIGANQLILQSPLYASQVRHQLQSQNQPYRDMGTMRIQF